MPRAGEARPNERSVAAAEAEEAVVHELEEALLLTCLCEPSDHI